MSEKIKIYNRTDEKEGQFTEARRKRVSRKVGEIATASPKIEIHKRSKITINGRDTSVNGDIKGSQAVLIGFEGSARQFFISWIFIIVDHVFV